MQVGEIGTELPRPPGQGQVADAVGPTGLKEPGDRSGRNLRKLILPTLDADQAPAAFGQRARIGDPSEVEIEVVGEHLARAGHAEFLEPAFHLRRDQCGGR